MAVIIQYKKMAKFYKYYPTTDYYIDEESTSVDTLTNLTTFFSFEQGFKNNSVVYDTYSIQENETPEVETMSGNLEPIDE